MDRKTVLKDSKEQLVVDSVKCCGHVQEDESTYATLVNAIDEIVVDFHQSCLGRVVFAVS